MPLTRITGLTTDRFHRNDQGACLTLGQNPALLPPSLAQLDRDGSERRRKRQLALLDSLQADVIAFQELRGWDAGGWWRLWEAANKLEMTPLPPVLSRRGRGNHLALLYRPQTVRVVDYDADPARRAFYHGVGRARLEIRDQPVLTVLFTHLCFLGGTERYAEAQWLTAYGDT
ncbi:hypothetical protein ACFVRB_19020 [Streptomyces nojiriensis]|uniref:hypothetical protein n=1 Tax=Streptomyces nojiriensis TaxID=66374 RepID=UPI0036D98548